MKLITLLIPAYNEEATLCKLYERVKGVTDGIPSYDFEILFVNDGSRDKTAKIIKDLREKDKSVRIVSLSRNFGKEAALLAGLDHALGDAVIIMDADLQDPPELIPQLISKWEEGYDDVYAKRTSRKGETFMKKFTSKAYYRLLGWLTGTDVQPDSGDFRLLDRRCVNALTSLREDNRATKSLFSWIGYKKIAVPFERDARIAGTTKWNYPRLISLAMHGICALTVSPLRLSALVSLPFFAASLIYIICTVIASLLGAYCFTGISAVILLILIVSGINFVLLGVIGEYLGKAFANTRGRPVYLLDFVDEEKETNENLRK